MTEQPSPFRQISHESAIDTLLRALIVRHVSRPNTIISLDVRDLAGRGTNLVIAPRVMIAGQTQTREHQTSFSGADEWFEALDQRVIRRGPAQWVASVLGVHGDGREWWVDVASAANPTANVVLRLSRHATVFHAVAALRRHRPRMESSAPVIDVMIDVMGVC